MITSAFADIINLEVQTKFSKDSIRHIRSLNDSDILTKQRGEYAPESYQPAGSL